MGVESVILHSSQSLRAPINLAYQFICDSIKQPNLAIARQTESVLNQTGLYSVLILANSLIRLYAACGSLIEARQAFEKIPGPDQYAWNTIFNAHAKLEDGQMVLRLYDKMLDEGGQPNKFTFPSILKACRIIGSIEQGKSIHEQVFHSVYQSDIIMEGALVDLYAKCGGMEEAGRIFQNLTNRNVITWNSLIAGYAQHGDIYLALEFYEDMKHQGVVPSEVTFLSIIKACGSIGALGHGRYVHQQIIECGLNSKIAVGNVLVDMYVKCGSLLEALVIFNRLTSRNPISWGAMIAGYAQHGEFEHVLESFGMLMSEGLTPNNVTFPSILKACGCMEAIEQGRCLHEYIIRRKLFSDLAIANSLVDMYARCGSMEEASKVFDKLQNKNVVSWGVIIAGFVRHGKGLLALEFFENMQVQGIEPNKMIYSSIFKACGSIGAIEQGRCIHEQNIETGLIFDIFVGNALLDMYAKCTCLEEACRSFDSLATKDVVTWNAMITAYAQHDEGVLALECFDNMQRMGTEANTVTFLNMLKACGKIGALEQARCIYEKVSKGQFQLDIILGSTLVDTYAKCGSLCDAYRVFKKLPTQNIASWGAMISGYAQLGEIRLTLQCFDDMQLCGIKPNDMVFTGLLTAFSRAGLVDEGLVYFKSIREKHGMCPDVLHAICMMDLFGRAGCFSEVKKLLEVIMQDNVSLWMTLLNACRMYNNVNLGRQSFDEIIRLDPTCAAAYVLMSSIYSTALTKGKVNKRVLGDLQMWKTLNLQTNT